ncbi:unnamed protein product [Absidia cylindrospora]
MPNLHLRQPIKLAVAMNIIGHLRRMEVFDSERELRMVFLQCRHDCVEQRLERIKKPTDDAAVYIVSSSATMTTAASSPTTIPTNSQDTFDYLKRYVDVMREQMFEMATHYTSIFSSNEADTILSDYMTHMVMQIQHILTEHLHYIDDTSALASLLTQLQYCGMSLGRVGLDFRHLFVSSFEQAVKPLVLRTMDQATKLLSIDTLQAATNDQILPSTWLNTNNLSGGEHSSSSSSPPQPQPSRMASSLDTTTSTNSLPREQHPYQPPITLVDYPCLAVFTNGILTALNALRLLPALELFPVVNQHLNNCLLEIAAAIKQYGDQVAQQFTDESVFVDPFATVYARYCVPFLQRCLVEGIFGYSVEHEEGGLYNNNITKNIEEQLLDYLAMSTPSKLVTDSQDSDKVDDKVDNKVNDKMDDKVDDDKVDDKVGDKVGDDKVDENVDDDKVNDKVDFNINGTPENSSTNNNNADSLPRDTLSDEATGNDLSSNNDSTNTESINKEPIVIDDTDTRTSNDAINSSSAYNEQIREPAITNEPLINDVMTNNAPENEVSIDNTDQELMITNDTGNTHEVVERSK